MSMYSFPRQLKGNCIHCNKEIYTFDDPDYNWLDHAAFVEKVGNSSCRIVGGYGSTTMDMSVAEFVDYDLYKKCVNEMNESGCFNLYICDDCVTKLLNEGKVAYSEEFRHSPVGMIVSEEHPKGFVQYANEHPNLRRKNIYVPIQKYVFAFKFNDGPEKIVEEMRKYETFIREDSPWTIEYFNGDEVVVIENKKEDWWIPIHKDEVLVVYDREDDFLVLPERIFNKHYRYAV